MFSTLLETALEAVARALGELGVPWMVIGGIAGIAHGIRRLTTDIDVAVRGDAVTASEILSTGARSGLTPRIEDAVSFAEANLVLLLRHQPTGVDIDLSFAWSSFEHEALAARTEMSFGRARAPMCTPSDLLLFKALAGRPKDEGDAEALLLLYPKIDVVATRARLVEMSEIAEAPELVAAFDRQVARTRKR